MPLVFHKIEEGRNRDCGASVATFLEEGIKSQQILMEEGKLPQVESPYFKALERYKIWREKRIESLKDRPETLRVVLNNYSEQGFVSGHELFFKPGFIGHRRENIYFSYMNQPPMNRDWVAIKVSPQEYLYNAPYRDLRDPEGWYKSKIKIQDYQNMNGRTPGNWHNHYNELLKKDRVLPSEIVAYAKVEKEIPIDTSKLSAEQLTTVKQYLQEPLSFATYFDDPEKSILLCESRDSKYQIRVAFDKEKACSSESQEKILKVFSEINSVDDLCRKASPSSSLDNIKKHPQDFCCKRG